MNYLYLLLATIVLFFIADKMNGTDYNLLGDTGLTTNGNLSIDKVTNPTNIGFVKPEHKLLKIFNDISNGSKIKLSGKCSQFIYNKNTINSELNEKLTYLIKDIINSVNQISQNDYYIKKIENVYCLIDRKKNQRYITDFFIYDTKNYYTIRLIADIVIIDEEIYINYLHIQSGSNTTLINNYDVKFNSIGILFDSNMFHEDLIRIFDNYYSNSFRVVGVTDTNLEYNKEDLTEVLSLNSFKNAYIPPTISKDSYKELENKDLNGYLDMYLPENQDMIKSTAFCNKYKTQWDSYGVADNNDTSNTNCYINNNSTREELNDPWFGPGVIHQRVSNNTYKWLNDPSKSNLSRGQGYHL
jgi:hypothetical protein